MFVHFTFVSSVMNSIYLKQLVLLYNFENLVNPLFSKVMWVFSLTQAISMSILLSLSMV